VFKYICPINTIPSYPSKIWLRIGTSGGLLWTWKWAFVFHKILGTSWVAAQLAASQKGLSSMKLVAFRTAFLCIAYFSWSHFSYNSILKLISFLYFFYFFLCVHFAFVCSHASPPQPVCTFIYLLIYLFLSVLVLFSIQFPTLYSLLCFLPIFLIFLLIVPYLGIYLIVFHIYVLRSPLFINLFRSFDFFHFLSCFLAFILFIYVSFFLHIIFYFTFLSLFIASFFFHFLYFSYRLSDICTVRFYPRFRATVSVWRVYSSPGLTSQLQEAAVYVVRARLRLPAKSLPGALLLAPVMHRYLPQDV
jgi:hypothetical protein